MKPISYIPTEMFSSSNGHAIELEVVGEYRERHLTIHDVRKNSKTFYFTADEWEALTEFLSTDGEEA